MRHYEALGEFRAQVLLCTCGRCSLLLLVHRVRAFGSSFVGLSRLTGFGFRLLGGALVSRVVGCRVARARGSVGLGLGISLFVLALLRPGYIVSWLGQCAGAVEGVCVGIRVSGRDSFSGMGKPSYTDGPPNITALIALMIRLPHTS